MRTDEKTTEILSGIITLFQEAYRKKIEATGHTASGQLLDKLSFTVECNQGEWCITLKMQDYWKYLEYGTRPHFPPVNAIMKWIEVKKILPRSKKTGKFLPRKSFAFAICKKIAKEGTPATHLLEKTMNEFSFKNKIIRGIVGRHRKRIEEAFSVLYASNK